MNISLIDQITPWIGPAGIPPSGLSPLAELWLNELATERQAHTAAGWPFEQVYPHLTRLSHHEKAGNGWLVELRLMVDRWRDRMPLSSALYDQVRARTQCEPGVSLSSDQ